MADFVRRKFDVKVLKYANQKSEFYGWELFEKLNLNEKEKKLFNEILVDQYLERIPEYHKAEQKPYYKISSRGVLKLTENEKIESSVRLSWTAIIISTALSLLSVYLQLKPNPIKIDPLQFLEIKQLLQVNTFFNLIFGIFF